MKTYPKFYYCDETGTGHFLDQPKGSIFWFAAFYSENSAREAWDLHQEMITTFERLLDSTVDGGEDTSCRIEAAHLVLAQVKGTS